MGDEEDLPRVYFEIEELADGSAVIKKLCIEGPADSELVKKVQLLKQYGSQEDFNRLAEFLLDYQVRRLRELERLTLTEEERQKQNELVEEERQRRLAVIEQFNKLVESEDNA
ncbi:hypothetical protein [Chroococcidiopsis sp. CCMEE 29]|uniref:hypothetical protein n=1 Tax=Chroococcidiopsis sp. CCMEE 29 TaxID=155894 RepID=UPI0020221FC6|nr:hypothetical protein [Chroococcidiopsis sp. CCMEE 29]